MVHPLILKKHGVTRERLREIFEKTNRERPTNPSPEDHEKWERWEGDQATRKEIELEIQDRVQAAVAWGARNYHFYAAVDMAWDSTSVSKVMVPLMMYAQGKIKLDNCAQQLAGAPGSESYIKRDKNGQPSGIDLPKFAETAVNVVRSVVTRRHAAQSVKYSNLYPYYKYESRSTGQVGKCKADVMSQEAEIMVDGFGYRHHDSQVMRDGFLYAHAVDFISSAWETHKHETIDPVGESFNAFSAGGGVDLKMLPTKCSIYKEGLSWVCPHPTRLMVDDNYPLSAINDDVGPEFIGYWDIVRYRDVADNAKYFNTKAVSHGTNLWKIYSTYNNFFTQYYDRITAPAGALIPVQDSASSPTTSYSGENDVAGNNDRKANIGIYSGEEKDMSMFKGEYFRKLIPKKYGIGTYPYPMWFRFVFAGDSTVVYAEPLFSKPAAALSINESDNRQLNASFGHDVLWAQDMMSNLISQMMVAVQNELLKVFAINEDIVNPDDIKLIKNILKGREFSAHGPIVIPLSLQKLAGEMDLKLDAVFKIGETQQSQSVTTIIQAMGQLMNLLERLASMSPAEQGQPAPREISATEVTEMAQTTQSVYSFISDAIDEFRSSKKRIVYESLACAKSSQVQVPVLGRYSRKTIEAAGFRVAGTPDEVAATDRPSQVNVTGDSIGLVHDYVFTSRDGSERPVNTQAANSIVQLLQVVLQVPEVREKIGREKIYEMFNEIFRLSGTGADLLLEMQEGDSSGFGEDSIAAMGQMLEQLKAALQEIAKATQQNAESVAQQEQTNEKQDSVLQGLMEALELVKQTAKDIDKLNVRMERAEKAPKPPEVGYRDAPEEIRRQIENANGFTAPQSPQYLEMELAKQADTKKSVAGII